MFKNPKELVFALDTEGEDSPPQARQMGKVATALGSLILKLLPEGSNKELAKQRLIECIFYCKQSLRLHS